MLRSASFITKMAVVAVIGLFVVAQASEAQFRFTYGSGGNGGTRIGVGIGQPYYGGYYGGYGRYGSPYYQQSYPYYGSPYNPYYVAPQYYYEPGYVAPTTSYQSFYPPINYTDPSVQQNGAASIEVICPPNAELWFDNHKTQQTGPARIFNTPPLSGPSSYELRANYTDASGKAVTSTRTVNVAPNQHAVVNFMEAGK